MLLVWNEIQGLWHTKQVERKFLHKKKYVKLKRINKTQLFIKKQFKVWLNCFSLIVILIINVYNLIFLNKK